MYCKRPEGQAADPLRRRIQRRHLVARVEISRASAFRRSTLRAVSSATAGVTGGGAGMRVPVEYSALSASFCPARRAVLDRATSSLRPASMLARASRFICTLSFFSYFCGTAHERESHMRGRESEHIPCPAHAAGARPWDEAPRGTRIAKHARLYVLRKVCISEDNLVWYDWQFHSIFPHMFRAFGSLRLICQEGVDP